MLMGSAIKQAQHHRMLQLESNSTKGLFDEEALVFVGARGIEATNRNSCQNRHFTENH